MEQDIPSGDFVLTEMQSVLCLLLQMLCKDFVFCSTLRYSGGWPWVVMVGECCCSITVM